ncbi:E3 ubiquitin-protein ligase RSL1-like [Impatiens glandulifera]|uniref:E3 ubiquitin-protein ligase RSL1-like n=1 Tax=Impatiens glandulifera TaxID=253017 RepID=UPI001FB06E9F|nr:E3 ubiquitin-protein ligase RSL1-like [Impatiens glandulifera]
MDTIEEEEELLFLAMEQSRELVAAGAMAIDLDLAFNMQMQEAMNASLAPHCSTSILSPQEESMLSLFDYQFEGAVADDYLASVIAEDIVTCEQEKRDHIMAESEMLRLKEEIGRVVHDMRFANELNQVPESQWEKNGDNIEKPYGSYGDGASSSHSAPVTHNNEVFNLYTKGILWKGTDIRGQHKIWGGIGIALCDLGNNLVFRMAKPVVAVEMVSEVVELKALAEGLNIALQLGIKRLSLFIDDAQLHGYVQGTLKPNNGNVASLIGQLTLLFRKFSHCTSTLVEQKDVSISVKLAQEAIDSQITREAEDNNSGKNSVNCSICLEDTDNFQMYNIEGCLHSYCLCCMKQHVEVQLLNGILPKCPHEGCKSSLTPESCKQFLPSKLYDILMQRVTEASIPAMRRIYCPNPKCSVLMSSTLVLRSGHTNEAIKCVNCRMLFCGHCKVPWHSNMSCETYVMLYPNQTEGDAKLKSVAAQNKWRQCFKCKNMVELREGCYHIYCRCGHEFCYTCGAEWRNKGATCKCPIWDEKNIIR